VGTGEVVVAAEQLGLGFETGLGPAHGIGSGVQRG